MELAKGILIPVVADFILSPDVLYSEKFTGIYFETEDEQYGRITFEKLDSIKISRGESLPFKDNYESGQEYPWVFKVENSKWLKERYDYEHENYGSSYEFGGNVNEMLTDFSHYLFNFHDEFIEVIAKGFWFEKDTKTLFKKELQLGHPFLNLPEINIEKFTAHNLTCQVRTNAKSQEQFISDATFCSQKLMEFALELDGNATIDNSLILFYRNEKLTTSLRSSWGNEIATFDGIAKFDDVKPHIEKFMQEVNERRNETGK